MKHLNQIGSWFLEKVNAQTSIDLPVPRPVYGVTPTTDDYAFFTYLAVVVIFLTALIFIFVRYFSRKKNKKDNE